MRGKKKEEGERERRGRKRQKREKEKEEGEEISFSFFEKFVIEKKKILWINFFFFFSITGMSTKTLVRTSRFLFKTSYGEQRS